MDIAGFIPVVGTVTNIVSGIWYASEGDYLAMGLSFASAIPIAGDISDGIKVSADAVKIGETAVKGAEDASEIAKATESTEKALKESSTALVPYYPSNNGFLGEASEKTFQVGEMFDRYGYNGGTFGAPVGTPAEMRALEPGALSKPYNIYKVIKPFDGLEGQTAPWFGQIGMGTQYKFGSSIQELLDQGYIKRSN